MFGVRCSIAVGAVAVCVLVGCGSDNHPKASSSSGPSSSSTSASAAAEASSAAAAAAACGRLTRADFTQALGVAFEVTGKPTDTHCSYQGADGSHLSLVMQPLNESSADDLRSSQGGCDAGTVQSIAVGDGGFTCLGTGFPEAVVLSAGIHYQLDALLLVSIDNDTARRGLAQLLTKLI